MSSKTCLRLPWQKADESLNFDEQILEAAKSIAAATAALVKSASAAQRELVAQRKVSSLLRPCAPLACSNCGFERGNKCLAVPKC